MSKTLTKAKTNLCFSVFLSDLIIDSSLLMRLRGYVINILHQYIYYTSTILQLYYNIVAYVGIVWLSVEGCVIFYCMFFWLEPKEPKIQVWKSSAKNV